MLSTSAKANYKGGGNVCEDQKSTVLWKVVCLCLRDTGARQTAGCDKKKGVLHIVRARLPTGFNPDNQLKSLDPVPDRIPG